ncbi:uncharacterized protein LOC141853190 [Brevipalpus obovatus]|uniref:uncharacterized protein LOC141853190 n=1 Tax=Brevipalpus obovatus TaxID=246614 RepID=UPI003D9E6C64
MSINEEASSSGNTPPSTSEEESELSPTILASKWKDRALKMLNLMKSMEPLISRLLGDYSQLGILLMEILNLVFSFLKTFDGRDMTLQTFKASLSKLFSSIFSNFPNLLLKLVVPVLIIIIGIISSNMTSLN